MKRLLLFVVASVVFGGNLFSTPIVFEDENYVTIFDDKTLLGDCNFNLIRLYKADVKPRFRKAMPDGLLAYTKEFGEFLKVLGLAADMKRLSIGYKKIIADKDNKDYFYHTFSPEVDNYLFERLEISSTVRNPEACNVWSVPGEIIYFDDQTKEPCSVEVGAFQYTIDSEGVCSMRCFTLYGRSYLVTGKDQEIHRCWRAYSHLDRTAVGDQISRFLAQQNGAGFDFFTKSWCKAILRDVNHYNSHNEVEFL